MKSLKIALPLLFLALFPLQQANAAVISTSQSCSDTYSDDTVGVYYPYIPPVIINTTCTTLTSSTYALTGTVDLYSPNYRPGISSPSMSFSVTGTMTQDESVSTQTAGDTYGDIYTTMTFDVTGLGTYSMTKLVASSGNSAWLVSATNSISGNGMTTDNTTMWDIWSDGVNAIAFTLDGDNNGKPGLNLYVNGVRTYIADVHLSAVPVPAAFWLFGTGLIGLVGVAKRKHRV